MLVSAVIWNPGPGGAQAEPVRRVRAGQAAVCGAATDKLWLRRWLCATASVSVSVTLAASEQVHSQHKSQVSLEDLDLDLNQISLLSINGLKPLQAFKTLHIFCRRIFRFFLYRKNENTYVDRFVTLTSKQSRVTHQLLFENIKYFLYRASGNKYKKCILSVGSRLSPPLLLPLNLTRSLVLSPRWMTGGKHF